MKNTMGFMLTISSMEPTAVLAYKEMSVIFGCRVEVQYLNGGKLQFPHL